VAGKVGHPKRPRSEAATFGRLVEAERAAGARTIGQAMETVRKQEPKRWGSLRKMEILWAEFKKLKRLEAAVAPDIEALLASLEEMREAAEIAEQTVRDVRRGFPRLSARSLKWLEKTADAPLQRTRLRIAEIEAEFARNPLLANWREKAKPRPK
jgi:hypothetical protein